MDNCSPVIDSQKDRMECTFSSLENNWIPTNATSKSSIIFAADSKAIKLIEYKTHDIKMSVNDKVDMQNVQPVISSTMFRKSFFRSKISPSKIYS